MHQRLRRRPAIVATVFALLSLGVTLVIFSWLFGFFDDNGALEDFGTRETPIIAAIVVTAALTYLLARYLKAASER